MQHRRVLGGHTRVGGGMRGETHGVGDLQGMWEKLDWYTCHLLTTPMLHSMTPAFWLMHFEVTMMHQDGPHSMSTRCNIFPYNAAATTTVDAASTIDSDSPNSFCGFTLPQPPSNEPSHLRSTNATTNNCNCQQPQLAMTATMQSTNSTMKEIHASHFVCPSHPHWLPNLASLHGSVNWHLHCTCEVYGWSWEDTHHQYWLVMGGYTSWVWVHLGQVENKLKGWLATWI